MKRLALLTASTAYANAAAVATAPKPAARAGAPKSEDRVAPVFTPIASDIQRPVTARRGAKSPIVEEMHKLEVGQSIGLTNKSKKQISATVSKENNRDTNQRAKLDASGQIVTKSEPIKDANGLPVGMSAPITVMERVKEWEVHEVDPKSDPHKAITRIFRVK